MTNICFDKLDLNPQNLSRAWLVVLVLIMILSSLYGCGSDKYNLQNKNDQFVHFEEFYIAPLFLSPTISKSHNVSHVFTFVNQSEYVVLLEVEKTSCGCARVNIDSKTVKPGESSKITLSIDLGYSRKKLSEYVVIKTSLYSPRQLVYQLTVDTYPVLEIVKEDSKEFVCDFGKNVTTNWLCRSYSLYRDDDSAENLRLESNHSLLVIEYDKKFGEKVSVIDGIKIIEKRYILNMFCPSPEFVNGVFDTYLKLRNSRDSLDSKVA